MKVLLFALVAASLALNFPGLACAQDVRDGPMKDLNGYFPFQPPANLESWHARRAEIRRRILVSQGLWPMPTKTPLNPVIHGKMERQGYSIEKVYFESIPGLFVTGNLYRPANPKGKVPAVLVAHGHWRDARLALNDEKSVRQQIAIGAERFTEGGRSVHQALCVQLARMGCVVWQWDMLSDSDSVQIPREVVHNFAEQRPEMNTRENWGFYSAQAEAHLQSLMGVQTLNAVRGLDFVLGLPEVDPARVAVTGASGGGTQTMMLCAIDDRPALAFPCVMVSTAMQGGCTCENASLLRVGTGNVEFAALFAPRPLLLNTANDWTKEMATKGFPQLQDLYTLYHKQEAIQLSRGEHFEHNYNAVTRSAFCTFLNRHFKLGLESPVIESDYEPLGREDLSVWDAEHPAPMGGDPEFERSLLRWLHEDAQGQIRQAVEAEGGVDGEGVEALLRPALETMIGRGYRQAGKVAWKLAEKEQREGYLEMTGSLHNVTHKEEIRVRWLYPESWRGQVVIWLDDRGRAGAEGAEIQRLLAAGVSVVGVDLFRQGGPPVERTRVVDNPRESAAYTFGYNDTLFARRVHDVLSILSFLRNTKVEGQPRAGRVSLHGSGNSGVIALAARALAGPVITKCAVDTGGFRFGEILDYRDPMFLPGAAKYLDVPGLVLLNGTWPLRVEGEGNPPTEEKIAWLLE